MPRKHLQSKGKDNKGQKNAVNPQISQIPDMQTNAKFSQYKKMETNEEWIYDINPQNPPPIHSHPMGKTH